ncbi:MAG: hypothetical protein D6748_09615 [Calditrichaeota bacterium]|nr:MAG: hypothetical protein D6748_09615 [Calditrichota bacterium]
MAKLQDYLSEKYQGLTATEEIERRLLELSSLFEISQQLNQSLDLERILNTVLLIPMGRLLIPRGVIFLKKSDGFRILMAKGLKPALTSFTLPEAELKNCISQSKKPVLQLNDIPSPVLKSFAQDAGLEICIPFISNQQVLGMVLFSKKLNGHNFSPEELNFLSSLANIAATSIQNALQVEEIREINQRLDEKIHQLNTLFDIDRGLSSTLDFNEILRLLGLVLMGQMKVTRYGILLKREKGFKLYQYKGISPSEIGPLEKRLRKISAPNQAVRIESLLDNDIIAQCHQQQLEVCIPMVHQNELLGYIFLGKKAGGETYDSTDLEFLTTLVSQAVISLENARMFQETLEKQRLEEELNVARTIQKKLLPHQLPNIPGYEVSGMNIPSKQVGGDYYDVIPLGSHTVALAIGDVAGKGVPAALLMANLQAALRIVLKFNPSPQQIISQLNNLICENTDRDKFITFFLAILNTREHTLTYVNAGHNYPILVTSTGTIQTLEEGGLILGVVPDYPYQSSTIQLKKGDLLYCYTDGVTEAVNHEGEEFGEELLLRLLNRFHKLPLTQSLEKIWQKIVAYSSGIPQADDVTMLAIKRNG